MTMIPNDHDGLDRTPITADGLRRVRVDLDYNYAAEQDWPFKAAPYIPPAPYRIVERPDGTAFIQWLDETAPMMTLPPAGASHD